MNAYRIALILCRAVIISLWWRAGLSLVAGFAMVLLTRAGIFGTRLPPITETLWMPLGAFVFTVIIASFLGIFAPSFCAYATGSAMLEGESLLSRGKLEPQERTLSWTGAGFILLFSAVTSIFPSLALLTYELFFTSIIRTPGIGRDVTLSNFAGNLIPLTLYCFAGFILAFRLGLRRVVKAQ